MLGTEQGLRAAGERRLVTVLFLDLSGFSGLCERRDPEQVTALLNALFAEVAELVERYEGWLDKFIGDAAMVVFGAPVAREDDAERAARVAWEMMQRCARLSERLGEDPPLRLHAGIASGTVIAGVIGAGRAAGYTVLGDAVNVASRLLDQAQAGEVLLSGSTHALLRGHLQTHARGEVAVRGRLAPVPVYALAGVDEAEADAEARTPFVGRDPELGQLRAAVAAAARGAGACLRVTGAAGMGKSRLIQEALRGGAEGLRVHRLRAHSYATPTPYLPWRPVLRELIEETQFAEAAQVEGLLQGSGAGGEAWRDAAVQATRALVRAACAVAPRALVFEEQHWSDQASLQLFEALAEDAAGLPLLLIGVRRGREGAVAGALHLGPLSAGECRLLVDRLYSGETFPSALRRSLLRRSGGVPLYIEELVRLAEAGRENLSAPLLATLAARLDRLDVGARARLEVASVAGLSFSPALVDGILGASEPEVWAALEEEGVLEPEAGGALRFRQVLLQEALYARLLQAERRRLHGEIADRTPPGTPDGEAERALHLSLAGRPEEAAPAWLAAAARARAVHALDDALAHLGRAMASTPHRAEALRRRATLYKWQGRGGEAIQDVEAALALEQDPCERVALLRERAMLAYLEGDGAGLIAWAERAVAEAEASGLDAARARAWRALGVAWEFHGRHADAIDAYKRVLAYASALPPEEERLLLGHTFNSVGEIARAVERFDQALDWYERARALGRGAEPPMNYLVNSGAALLGLGRPREALERLQRCVDEARRVGWRTALPETLCMRASARRALGDLAGAWRDLEEAATIAEEQEQAEWQAGALRLRAELLHHEGQLEAAERCMRESVEGFQRIGKAIEASRSARLLQALRAARGLPPAALDLPELDTPELPLDAEAWGLPPLEA
ncbi:MAG: AAA family ATPase [Alphaproteobacteria bacterium]|nr:AAA family ATPase [Alphaproteobacteria bacterium]